MGQIAQDSAQADREFERRSRPYLTVHLLGLLPVLALAGLVRLEQGKLPSVAIIITCAVYVTVTLLQYLVMRSAVLKEMRREDVLPANYKPPSF